MRGTARALCVVYCVFMATAAAGAAPDPGALITMRMDSRVAVLLDEIAAGDLRERAAAEALSAGESFWTARAEQQVGLTYYRLVYRGGYYSAAWSANPHSRGPLPLPPRSVWQIELSGAPVRTRLDGHDMVVRPFTFSTALVTDAASPGAVEPALAAVGGTWTEPFDLPADPELLLQRTGYACMDEAEYPPHSVFEENTSYFYDDSCHVESLASSSCHITVFPKESCTEALKRNVGLVRTGLTFTRVPYDPATADAYRVGTITNPDGADLAVVTEGMERERAVFYRFFGPGSCDLGEGTISKLGWRRLLAFSAIARNDGTERIHIGNVTDPASPWVTSNVFEFSPCHHHFHFSFYGVFGYAGAPGSKRAFCLEDTNRFHNDERTPLTAEHQSCSFQGMGRGWGDEYEWGIPGQWVDVTDVGTSGGVLTFHLNPEHFLCEGKPVLDASGNPIFDPTPFTDAQGRTISRMRCDLFPGWDANNLGSVPFSQASGSFVTEPCGRGQIGPLRDCGFAEAAPPLHSCVAGQPVRLNCSTPGPAQVLRVCERSEELGTGVACALGDSIANATVTGTPTGIVFACPAVRDAAVGGTGGYSVYSASVLPSQPASVVACSGW